MLSNAQCPMPMPKTMRNAECGTSTLFVLFGGIPSLRFPDALGSRRFRKRWAATRE